MGEQHTRIAVARWNEVAWEPMRPGVDRKVFSGQGATLQLTRLRPGHVVRPHEHSYEQIVHIISGDAEFHVGDEVFIVETENGILITPYDPTFEQSMAAYKRTAAKYRNALRELAK